MKKLLVALLLVGLLISCKKEEEFNPQEQVECTIKVLGNGSITVTLADRTVIVYDKITFTVPTNSYVIIKSNKIGLSGYNIITKSFDKTYFINDRETINQPIY